MQPNSYSNDPNYTQPNETNPPTPPYQQGGQYVQPPYQGQQGGPYTPPPYQGQQGQPVSPYQYTNQPPPVQQSSAMREGESRKYAIGKIIDFIRWVIVACTKGAFIDWSTLIGMAVYAILYLILRLFLRTTVSRPEEPIE